MDSDKHVSRKKGNVWPPIWTTLTPENFHKSFSGCWRSFGCGCSRPLIWVDDVYYAEPNDRYGRNNVGKQDIWRVYRRCVCAYVELIHQTERISIGIPTMNTCMVYRLHKIRTLAVIKPYNSFPVLTSVNALMCFQVRRFSIDFGTSWKEKGRYSC